MNAWRKKIDECGLSPLKEYSLFFLGLLVCLGAGAFLYWHKKQIGLLIYPGLALLLFIYFYFSRYSSLLRKKGEKKESEFIVLFTYFSVFLQDGFNVYNALEEVVDFAEGELKGDLKELLKQIEADKSLQPFLSFSAKFKSLTIREVMISVYQMVDQGASGAYLQQFRHLFGKLSDQKHDLEKRRKKERLESLTILPLLGSGIAMLALMMALLEIIGGMLRVI